MTWRALNGPDLLAVARQMRESDRREIFATRFDDDTGALVADLLASDPLGAIMLAADGSAVAAIGASEMWPGNWAVWMFTTDRWPEVAREATRFARGVLGPTLQRLGGRRAECRSALAHKVAHRWLIHLGAEVEAVYPDFGRDGETFVGFVFYGEKDMCGLPKSQPKPVQVKQPNPIAADNAVAEAADQELRRLRALNGRRSTILTPVPSKLGSAPTSSNNLLGS
jgi:hypothetical protein